MDIMSKCSEQRLKVMPKPVFAELPETYTLTQEQLNFFNDNGYLVLKELVDSASLYSVKQRFIEICNGNMVNPGFMRLIKEPALIKTGAKGEDLFNKVQEILFDDDFKQYTENPRLLHVISQFLGDDITAMHSMFINKPPGSARHPPHQDLLYFPFRPADKIVGTWTAIDHVTLENGCLYVVPGSHKPDTLYEHGNLKDDNRHYHAILQENIVAPLEKRIQLEMSPGDTVFFHPLLVHGSGANVTKNYRKSISCHYASSSCHYIDVSGTLQQDVAAEMLALFKRSGFDVTFEDAWRNKSKQVKGVRSNL